MTLRTGRLAKLRTGAAITAALLVFGQAHAQSSSGVAPLGFLANLFTGSLSKGGQNAPSSQAQTAPGGGPLPWSGEDGASGHPLMTAAAIREAGGNFRNLVASR